MTDPFTLVYEALWGIFEGVISGAIAAVDQTPTAGGSGYLVNDELTLTTGNADAVVKVIAVDGGGAVTILQAAPLTVGSGYSVATGQATSGGTGTGCTVSVTDIYRVFTDEVKSGCRIKFSGTNRAPLKAEVLTADWPEVRLTCVGGTPHLMRTSSSSYVMKRFEIQVATGDQRYSEQLFPVEWAIYKAMSGWANTLDSLTWNGKNFVKQARLVDNSIGFSEADMARGFRGWTAVWAIEVEMWFDTADIEFGVAAVGGYGGGGGYGT